MIVKRYQVVRHETHDPRSSFARQAGGIVTNENFDSSFKTKKEARDYITSIEATGDAVKCWTIREIFIKV